MQKLKVKEAAVLEYIRQSVSERGYAPSVRDIGTALGYRSTSTVQMYLNRLEDYGYIRRENGKSRSVSLCEDLRTRVLPILREGGNPDENEFDGVLPFCYCGELDADVHLFACRISCGDGYAVVARGAEDEGIEAAMAFQTAEGVILRCDQALLGEGAVLLGRVIAVIYSKIR